MTSVLPCGSPTFSSTFLRFEKSDKCLFLHYKIVKVLNFDNNYSGVILLVGQLVDGLSTTVVGLLSDKQNTFILCR